MGKSTRRTFLHTAGSGALAGTLLSTLGSSAPIEERKPPQHPEPIKIGQIGVGHAHASKLAVYRATANYQVVGIVEPDPELRQQAEKQDVFRGLPWMTQEQLLNVPGLQAVLVETRVRDLLNTAQVCVAAGKHVHIDKPAGESLPQFRRILEQARQKNLLVQMGYMYRYNPAVVLLRQLLKDGLLGDVFEVHAVMSKVVDPVSRKGLAEYPGGIMFELGCHILDLVIGVLGKPLSVTPIAQHASTIDDALVDNMLAVLTYPRAIASVKSSAMEVDGGERRHLVVCGSHGTFQIQPLDNPSATITLSNSVGMFEKGTRKIQFPKYTRYVDDARDMVEIIRGEKPTMFSYEHDLIMQTTLLQACGLPLDK